MNYKKVILTIILLAVVTGGVLVPIHSATAGNVATEFMAAVFITSVNNYFSGTDAWIEITGRLINGVIFATAHVVPDVVHESWAIVRDFVNLFFILVLIIMAFGTIFSIEKYTYRELLPKFLIGALLINFSFFIAQYILIFSDQLSGIFANSVNNFTDTLSEGLLLQKLDQFFTLFLSDVAFSTGGGAPVLGTVLATGLGTYVAAIGLIKGLIFMGYLMLLIILLVRIPILWTLLILSPVAWIGYTLPAIRDATWGKWWRTFFKWAFYPPIFLLIMLLPMIFIDAKSKLRDSAIDENLTLSFVDQLGVFGARLLGVVGITDLFIFILTIGALYYGIFFALKVAGKIGEGVGDGFKKAGGYAFKGVKYAARKAPIIPAAVIGGKGVTTFDKARETGGDFAGRFRKGGAWGRFKGLRDTGIGGFGKDFFRGEDEKERTRKERADVLGEAFKYSPQFARQKAQMERKKEFEEFYQELHDQQRIRFEFERKPNADGTPNPDGEILKTFIQNYDEHGVKLNKEDLGELANNDGTLNEIAAAQRETMSKLGIISSAEEKELSEAYKNAGNAGALTQHAINMTEGSWKKLPDANLIEMVKATAGEDYEYLANSVYNGYRREILKYLKSEHGALAAEHMDADMIKVAMDLNGGAASNSAWEEVLKDANITPHEAGKAWGRHGQKTDGSKKYEEKDGDVDFQGIEYIVNKKDNSVLASSHVGAFKDPKFIEAVNRKFIRLEQNKPTVLDPNNGATRKGQGYEAMDTMLNKIGREGKPGSAEKLKLLREGLDMDWITSPINSREVTELRNEGRTPENDTKERQGPKVNGANSAQNWRWQEIIK